MLDEVIAYCRRTERGGQPLLHDPLVRNNLAELALIAESQRLLSYDSLGSYLAGRQPEYAGVLDTVVIKEAVPRVVELINDIVGPMSQLAEGSQWAPIDGDVEAWYRYSFGNHAGGTPQVKRMLLATRGLGLPR
jgi:alkylation response protein AidB-like acyl-CoA dehydrogenase